MTTRRKKFTATMHIEPGAATIQDLFYSVGTRIQGALPTETPYTIRITAIVTTDPTPAEIERHVSPFHFGPEQYQDDPLYSTHHEKRPPPYTTSKSNLIAQELSKEIAAAVNLDTNEETLTELLRILEKQELNKETTVATMPLYEWLKQIEQKKAASAPPLEGDNHESNPTTHRKIYRSRTPPAQSRNSTTQSTLPPNRNTSPGSNKRRSYLHVRSQDNHLHYRRAVGG